MSDLHLEKRSVGKLLKDDKRVMAPYLVLAGDIGDPSSAKYESFLVRAAEMYPGGVFVIVGNHECYGKTIEQAEEEACSACERVSETASIFPHRVVFLSAGKPPAELTVRSGTRVESVRVLGCTLWSHVPDEHACWIGSTNNDCRAIRDFDVSRWNARHAAELAWLRVELSETRRRGQRCVVVTHHAPLMEGTSAQEYEVPGRALWHAFASDLRELMLEFVDVAPAWIHGHTHFSHRTFIRATADTDKGVLLASNQRGNNKREACAGLGFSEDVTIDIVFPR
jgi:hypothetical protein